MATEVWSAFVTSSYYYYLALAYFYYFAGFGDFTNAVNYYYAFIAYAS